MLETLVLQITRFLALGRVFATVYAGYKLTQMMERGRLISQREARKREQRHHARSARLIYSTAVKLRGLPIKTGQFLGSRADILPDEYISVLSHLHDRVPPRPFPVIAERIEQEFHRPLSQVFASIDEKPIASASLAQVHKAQLPDGTPVAVKVQYPEIERLVRIDLRNMRLFAQFLARLEPTYDFRVVVTELSRYVPKELDFINEGRNAERVEKIFADRTDIVTPKIYWDYTTRRVLTMEYMAGIKISDVVALERAGVSTPVVAQQLVEAYCEQILWHGFFHADPHPGNILVQPPTDGNRAKLVLLDYGLSKPLPERFRVALLDLTRAILADNDAEISRSFRQLGFQTAIDDPKTYTMLADLFLGIALRENRTYADADYIEEINLQLAHLLRRNPLVKVPPDVVLIGRVMGLLSGLSKTLGSEVNLAQTLLAYSHA
jgi:predicted unusual protein kinase regulating ubiquinone biosynthesis (AarF/ABC1/UbiB family)